VVVLAPGVDAAAALAGAPVTVAVNREPGGDMASSVRVGLEALGPGVSGVLVLPADHPLVTAESVRALAQRHEARPDAVLIPCHGGRRGHPALFPAVLVGEVRAGRTLRDVREAHRELVEEIEVGDAGVVFDMDTWEDYLEARDLVEGTAGAPAREGDAGGR
jgi:molybdenum cofactor cytidylyltransferase